MTDVRLPVARSFSRAMAVLKNIAAPTPTANLSARSTSNEGEIDVSMAAADIR